MHDAQFPEQRTPWYKTGGGVAFLGALGMLAVLFLVFAGFVGYYVYQIQQGHGQRIATEIAENRNISTDTGDAQGAVSTNIDPTPYIRSYNPQYGNPTSPIKIVAFIDFECPYCRNAYPTFEAIRERYGSAAHIVFKHFPLTSIHPLATRAGHAAQCAHDQDAFWEYYQYLFEAQDLSQEALISYANTLGLNTAVFSSCISSESHSARITQDIQDGIALGVRGTPTYIIQTKKLEGVVPEPIWEQEILQALQQTQ